MKNNSVKLFLNIDQWLWRKCCLKYFLSRALAGSPFVQWSGTICANLVERAMRNNSLKLF